MINARSSGSLHRQVRRMLILCIAVVVLLSTSVGLGISLYQEVRTRDQLLSNAAQMAADAPLLTEDIRADNAQQYLARTVQRVSEVDMLGVYDIKGKPTVFYDLVSGAGDASLLPELKADTVSRLCSEEKPVLSNDEMPDGADRCAYAVMRDENGQVTGIVMAGLYLRSYHRTVLRVLLSYLLITLFALGIGSLLSVRFSERVKRELLGYEPDAFRQLFLQRMDILDALDEGLMAIDEHSMITYFYKQFSWKMLYDSLIDTAKTSAMVFIILFGASAFTGIFMSLDGDQLIATWISSVGIGKWGAFAIMMAIVFFMGMFLDWLGIVMIVFPIFLPIMDMFGFDRLWIVAVTAVMLQTCFMTPPFGFALFYIKGIVPPSVKIQEIYRGVIPFILIIIAVVILVTVFPQVVYFLPNLVAS